LELAIAGNEPDIILITEILPKACCNTLTFAHLFLNGYTPIYKFDPNVDVTTSPSIRGVGIYVSEKSPFCEVKFISSSCVENIWIKIISGAKIFYWLAAFIAVHHLTHTKALLNCVIC